MYKPTKKLDSEFVVQLAYICPCLEGLLILVRDIKVVQFHLHPTILIRKRKRAEHSRVKMTEKTHYVLLLDIEN
jgi:hypothetical protein